MERRSQASVLLSAGSFVAIIISSPVLADSGGSGTGDLLLFLMALGMYLVVAALCSVLGFVFGAIVGLRVERRFRWIFGGGMAGGVIGLLSSYIGVQLVFAQEFYSERYLTIVSMLLGFFVVLSVILIVMKRKGRSSPRMMVCAILLIGGFAIPGVLYDYTRFFGTPELERMKRELVIDRNLTHHFGEIYSLEPQWSWNDPWGYRTGKVRHGTYAFVIRGAKGIGEVEAEWRHNLVSDISHEARVVSHKGPLPE